jgi:integrase
MAKRRKRDGRRAAGSGYAAPATNGTWTAFYPKFGGGYHVKRGFRTREAAEAWCDSLVAQHEAGVAVSQGQRLVSAAIDAWIGREQHERLWKAKTVADVEFKLGYVKPFLGAMPVNAVMPDDVDAMLDTLARDLAPTTMRQIRNYLHQVFADAEDRRHILHNPVRKPKRRKQPRRRAAVHLAPAQIQLLLQQVAGSFYGPAWLLIVCLALRAGEVCGLRLVDLDLDARTLTIAQEYTDLHGTPHQDLPKNDKTRVLPLPRRALPVLAAHVERRTTVAATGQTHGRWQEHGLLFPGRGGRPLHTSSLLHNLHRAIDAVNGADTDGPRLVRIPALTTHMLRHTAAGLYTDVGCPEDVRAALLGHSPGTITRFYSPPDIETIRPWVDAVYDRIAGNSAERAQAENL